MNPERSGFTGCSFGPHEYGIHLAAGPDIMHMMLEGLGRNVVNCIGHTLKETGQIIVFLLLFNCYLIIK